MEAADLLLPPQGHEDAVQSVLFDNAGKFILTCGSDNTFRVWS